MYSCDLVIEVDETRLKSTLKLAFIATTIETDSYRLLLNRKIFVSRLNQIESIQSMRTEKVIEFQSVSIDFNRPSAARLGMHIYIYTRFNCYCGRICKNYFYMITGKSYLTHTVKIQITPLYRKIDLVDFIGAKYKIYSRKYF